MISHDPVLVEEDTRVVVIDAALVQNQRNGFQFPNLKTRELQDGYVHWVGMLI